MNDMRYSPAFENPVARIAGLSGLVILFWGLTAWLRILAGGIPPLELTGLALACATVCSWLCQGRQTTIAAAVRAHRWYVWPVVAGCLVGSSAFFFAALALLPAAQVVVVTYSWPLLFAIGGDVLYRRRPAALTFVAMVVGFAGVAVMQGVTQVPSTGALLGCLASLASGLCWVVYSLFVQVYPRPLGSAYPVFFALGTVSALAAQAFMGGLVMPHSALAVTAVLVLGIGPYGLGYLAWGYVVRHGNPRVVPVLPYAVPAVSALILVLVGLTQPTLSLLAGCLLVMTACVLSTGIRGVN